MESSAWLFGGPSIGFEGPGKLNRIEVGDAVVMEVTADTDEVDVLLDESDTALQTWRRARARGRARSMAGALGGLLKMNEGRLSRRVDRTCSRFSSRVLLPPWGGNSLTFEPVRSRISNFASFTSVLLGLVEPISTEGDRTLEGLDAFSMLERCERAERDLEESFLPWAFEVLALSGRLIPFDL